MTAPLAVVAMSGGVDSSVAAARLLQAGARVRGVSLRLWESPRADTDRVCSDWRDAAAVARELGIPHTVLDRRREFARRVVDPFADGYAEGRTPNPCPACNSEFKLGFLLEWALGEGASFVATGHYARVERREGRMRLRRGVDGTRDQSYFLFQLTQRQLERACFPLGELTKIEVRAEARRLGLSVAAKAESQDLCLGGPAALVARRGLGGREGEVVDDSGRVIGRHCGIEGFTVGQRRGLGVSSVKPLYVQALDAGARRVVVSSEPPRACGVLARGWSWVGPPADPSEPLTAQVRYRHRGVTARIERSASPAEQRLRFEEPAAAVAPGQAVVVYRGDEVVGGGWIEQPLGAAR